MNTYTVHAKRWAHGWELHIDDVGVTQSRTLSDAERMVRDYIATLHDLDEVTGEVVIVPNLGRLADRVRAARERTKEVETAQREAAREAREVARALRAEGLSVADTAVVLGVSKGRVSQLVS